MSDPKNENSVPSGDSLSVMHTTGLSNWTGIEPTSWPLLIVMYSAYRSLKNTRYWPFSRLSELAVARFRRIWMNGRMFIVKLPGTKLPKFSDVPMVMTPRSSSTYAWSMFCAVYAIAPVPVLNGARLKVVASVPYSTDVSLRV